MSGGAKVGSETVHRQDSSPTRILETVHRQNWRQFTDRFEDSSPTKVLDDGENHMCLYSEKIYIRMIVASSFTGDSYKNEYPA